MASPKAEKLTFKQGVPATDEVKELAISQLVNQLETKQFNSGKTGYYAQGKVNLNGERYQSQIMLVKIEKKD
jgi:hypothetical protein